MQVQESFSEALLTYVQRQLTLIF